MIIRDSHSRAHCFESATGLVIVLDGARLDYPSLNETLRAKKARQRDDYREQGLMNCISYSEYQYQLISNR